MHEEIDDALVEAQDRPIAALERVGDRGPGVIDPFIVEGVVDPLLVEERIRSLVDEGTGGGRLGRGGSWGVIPTSGVVAP